MHICDKSCQRERFLDKAVCIVLGSREDFFEWVTSYNDDFSRHREWDHNSLFEYFEAWKSRKQKALEKTFVADSDTDAWEEFAPLLPYIYITIIDEILVNPARLDYVHADKELGTSLTIPRPLRRVIFVTSRKDTEDDDLKVVLGMQWPAIAPVTPDGFCPVRGASTDVEVLDKRQR